MTGWQLLVICGGTVALNLAITESREIAYKRGYRAGVRAYRGRLNDVVSERDERRKHYPWRQPTGDQWADRVRRFGNPNVTVVDHECVPDVMNWTRCERCGKRL